jgi:hypothetical protein
MIKHLGGIKYCFYSPTNPFGSGRLGVQIGVSTSITIAVSMLATESSPMTGKTYVASDCFHCARCLACRQPAEWAAMYCSAASRKVLV